MQAFEKSQHELAANRYSETPIFESKLNIPGDRPEKSEPLIGQGPSEGKGWGEGKKRK